MDDKALDMFIPLFFIDKIPMLKLIGYIDMADQSDNLSELVVDTGE